MKRGRFTGWWWVLWAFAVAILLWIIIIAGVAKIATATAYELNVADKRVPLPTHDWKFFQQQCEDYTDDGRPIGCAFEWEVQLPHGLGAPGYWHETGHLFDFSRLTDAQRLEFKRIMGIPAETDWWDQAGISEDGEVDFNLYHPPGELFADAYSLCALRATGRPMAGVTDFWVKRDGVRHPVEVQGYGYPYKARWRQHLRNCQLIANSAGMHYNRKTGVFG